MVVAGYNLSAPAGSTLLLQCVSSRMVWTRDRVRDRQRVVHWDLFRDHPDYAMERVLDMFSAGDQRIYNPYNVGRVGLSPKAFKDGNFSLVIKGPPVRQHTADRFRTKPALTCCCCCFHDDRRDDERQRPVLLQPSPPLLPLVRDGQDSAQHH